MVTLQTGQPCSNVIMGIRTANDRPVRWIQINSAVVPGPARQRGRVFALFRDITAHLETRRALQQAQAELRAVLESVPDPIWLKDENGVFLMCNRQFARLYGGAEADIVGKTDFDFVDPTAAESYRRTDRQALAASAPSVFEEWMTYPAADSPVLLEKIKTPLRDNDGKLVGILGVGRDITQHNLYKQKLRDLIAYLSTIMASTPVGVGVFGPGRICFDANDMFLRIFGLQRDEMIGASSRLLYLDDRQFDDVGARAWPIIAAGGIFNDEVPMRRRDGSEICVRQVARLIDPKNPTLGIILTMDDISERRRLEDRLYANNADLAKLADELNHLARTDVLTGLANRRAFIEAAHTEFERRRRYQSKGCVLLIDLDRFKQVNDLHGHDAGDRALLAVADILARNTRAAELPARFGGEEFILLTRGIGLENAMAVAECIRAAVAACKLSAASGAFTVTVSIGVAQFADDDSTWSQAVSRADGAMYRAKRAGRNRVVAAADDVPPGQKRDGE
jgi:diguanylate cyclase (GGDEF)-like protein/PAS domain S-box-containing protein